MIAAPRLQSVFIAPVTGNWGELECEEWEEWEGTSREFRREASGDDGTKDGVELLLGVEGYNLACARFNSAGIDMTEDVGLTLSRTGSTSECLFNAPAVGLRARRPVVGFGVVCDGIECDRLPARPKSNFAAEATVQLPPPPPPPELPNSPPLFIPFAMRPEFDMTPAGPPSPAAGPVRDTPDAIVVLINWTEGSFSHQSSTKKDCCCKD